MTSAAHPDNRWPFDVLAAEAVDGDTARVLCDCGFGIRFAFDLRLAGIDAPELGEPGGPEAKAALQALLDRPGLVAVVHRRDTGGYPRSFARWIGELWAPGDGGGEPEGS